MIKTQQIAHALALHEHLNFHRAAEAVRISQPAFSRSIRSLEDNLGVTLFDRDTHGVTLTSHGEIFMRRARTIIAEAYELEREIELSKGPGFGELSVAMGVYAAEISGNKVIARLAHDHPKLNLRVSENSWQIVVGLVLDRSVDLGYANTDIADHDGRLDINKIAKHDVVFYCRSGHPLLLQSTISTENLRRFPVTRIRLPSRTNTMRPESTGFDRSFGHSRPSIEVENLAMARTIVAESDAFGLAMPLQIEARLRSGEFKVLPYSASKYTPHYGFITLRGRYVSPATHEFMKLARSVEVELASRNLELLHRYTPTP
jgi:DNA-binding transcriptional LysR family regulator